MLRLDSDSGPVTAPRWAAVTSAQSPTPEIRSRIASRTSGVRPQMPPGATSITPLAGQAALASGPSPLPPPSVKLTSTRTFLPTSAATSV